jgi:hypothetical protein
MIVLGRADTRQAMTGDVPRSENVHWKAFFRMARQDPFGGPFGKNVAVGAYRPITDLDFEGSPLGVTTAGN